jgi:hypothetical protein
MMNISEKCKDIGCYFRGFLGNGGFGRVYKIEYDHIIFAVKTFDKE